MIGFDTGFFLHLRKGTQEAVETWERIRTGEKGVVSIITLHELLKIGHKTGDIKTAINLIDAIGKVLGVIDVDMDVARRAAKLSHGLGMPSLSAFTLAGFLVAGAKEIHTSDKQFKIFKNKRVKIILLEEIERD